MAPVLSQTWQSWKTAKMVAFLSIVALAIGTGSVTAIYTVINAVMLKPMPYEHGERFVALFGRTLTDAEHYSSSTFPDLQKYQQRTTSFDAFGWFQMDNFNLTSPGKPQHVNGVAVTPDLVRELGVNPVFGQWFTDENGAVISSALWSRLGKDPQIIGKAVVLNGRSLTVTGVAPPQFRLPVLTVDYQNAQNDVWIGLDPRGKGQNPSAGMFFCYARLKPGVTFSQAEADVKRVAAGIAQEEPVSHPSYTARLDSLRDTVISGIRPTLLLLLGSAVLLLLITSANVAGLLLARSVSRARETAIRISLGATLRQLGVQYFLEALIISLAGAALGVLLSIALVRIVLSITAAYIPRASEISVDWSVLAFAAGAAGLASIAASMAPLWQALRIAPIEVIGDGTRSSAGARSRRLARSLVVAETALAFALLSIGGGLIVHLQTLNRSAFGFDPANLVTFQLTLPDAIVSNDARRVPYQAELIRSLEATPGVGSAASVNQLPLAGCCFGTSIYPEGYAPGVDITERTSLLPVSLKYFETMRIPLRSGRFFSEQDSRPDRLAAVINEAAARHYWPDRNPVGSFGHFGRPDGDRFQVIGVAGNVQNDGLGKRTVPEVYLMSTVVPVNPLYFVVRSALPLETLLPQIRAAVQKVDALVPVHDPETMREIARQSVTFERLSSFMTSFFALAALVMATLGVYGVVSYSVRQRVVELGTRMALGASGRNVMSIVIAGGLKMAVSGLVAGGLITVGAVTLLSRILSTDLFGIFPLLSSSAIVCGAAAAASFFPAWRASLVSPMVAIRNEPESMWQTARRSLKRAIEKVSQTVSGLNDSAFAVSDAALLTDFVEAARRAESSGQVLQIALTTLCEKLDARSGMLLEKQSDLEYRCAAVTPSRDTDDISVPVRGILLNRLRSCTFPLPLTADDFDTWLRWAEGGEPQYLSEINTLKNTNARLAVALRTNAEILGVLLLGPPARRDQYTAAEKRLLRVSAQQFALMIENARLTDRIVEQEKIRLDMILAAEVQRRLLPDEPPSTSVGTLAALSIPARSVGGDYYDFIQLGERGVGLAIADVAGKGIAAALIMSVVQASLRIIASEEGIPLPELAERMNAFLHRSTPSNSYATFFYARLDERNGLLHYVNAGHNSPYLVRSAEIVELPPGGTVIGLFPAMKYQDATIALHSGDVLIAFTDGVTEALNPVNEEFGEERLKGILRGTLHLSADRIVARLSKALRDWIRDAPQHDDLTFIVLKVH